MTAPQRGPRSVFEWVDDLGIFTLEIAATVDEQEIGHIHLTMESRPGDWDEGEKAAPSQTIHFDLDGTNAIKVRDALDAAVAWGREYLS